MLTTKDGFTRLWRLPGRRYALWRQKLWGECDTQPTASVCPPTDAAEFLERHGRDVPDHLRAAVLAENVYTAKPATAGNQSQTASPSSSEREPLLTPEVRAALEPLRAVSELEREREIKAARDFLIKTHPTWTLLAIDCYLASPSNLATTLERIQSSNAATDQQQPPTTGGSEQSEGAAEQFIFSETGAGYFIKGFGESGHVKKLKGFAYLAKLVAQPGTPILMTELLAATSNNTFAATAHSAADAAELLGAEPSDTADQKRLRLADDSKRSRQPAMDAAAKQQARERLQEIQEEIDDAKADNDPARQERAMEERERIMDELKAAIGVLGKDRDLNSQANKLRPRIQNRLTDAYKALRNADPKAMPELANHFEAAVSASGDTFSYSPLVAISWRTSQ